MAHAPHPAAAPQASNATPHAADAPYSGDADALLTPSQLADYLWERWRLKRGPRTLQMYRRAGGGPPFFRAGNDVRYAPELVDAWARELLGEPLRASCELRARRLLANHDGG